MKKESYIEWGTKRLDETIAFPRIAIPQSIFKDRTIAVLEALTEYLKDSLNMTYHEIAVLTARNDRTIWTAYNRAKQKRKIKPIMPRERAILTIPFSIFKDRELSVLEVITEYLKDKKQLTYHEIAFMLNRDDRTIWTVYDRVRKKRKAL
ncbi:hypothetical protein J4209_02760 [Candidatus Woesearchaeota archaeon]|nr:hypothetical protein [Candidatus Woesearchaeota archaeon]